jgi:hypothetical protein
VVPILVATEAQAFTVQAAMDGAVPNLLMPMCCTPATLGKGIALALELTGGAAIDAEAWVRGRYKPTPTIVEAAMALYARHSVADISRSDAANLGQTSGFVMAMFLAGLRGIDNEILKAAQIDGASNFSLYRRIVIPMLRPAFLSAFVILAHLAVKSYDLIIALTGGGPGRATELPATFMYSYTFTRNSMGIGAASAVIMLMTIAAIMTPYLYAELKEKS